MKRFLMIILLAVCVVLSVPFTAAASGIYSSLSSQTQEDSAFSDDDDDDDDDDDKKKKDVAKTKSIPPRKVKDIDDDSDDEEELEDDDTYGEDLDDEEDEEDEDRGGYGKAKDVDEDERGGYDDSEYSHSDRYEYGHDQDELEACEERRKLDQEKTDKGKELIKNQKKAEKFYEKSKRSAYRCLSKGDMKGFLRHSDEALLIYENDARLFFDRARCLERLKQYRQATREYRKAFNLGYEPAVAGIRRCEKHHKGYYR